MGDVIQFEVFKGSKELENEYPKFLGHIEKYFGTDINQDALFKRLYFTIRFLEGTANAFMILSLLGMPVKEKTKGKKVLVDWLEDIIKRIKEY